MASRTYADRQTYTRVLQCSHASVGLAQARPNYSTMVLIHSTGLYFTLQWLYLTLLDSTLLYHGSTSLY